MISLGRPREIRVLWHRIERTCEKAAGFEGPLGGGMAVGVAGSLDRWRERSEEGRA